MAILRSTAEFMRQTLTHDPGKKICRHAERSAITGSKPYFFDTYSTWQLRVSQRTDPVVPAQGYRSVGLQPTTA
jgi:IS30 family transposase